MVEQHIWDVLSTCELVGFMVYHFSSCCLSSDLKLCNWVVLYLVCDSFFFLCVRDRDRESCGYYFHVMVIHRALWPCIYMFNEVDNNLFFYEHLRISVAVSF